jgi:hypothetical protein
MAFQPPSARQGNVPNLSVGDIHVVSKARCLFYECWKIRVAFRPELTYDFTILG